MATARSAYESGTLIAVFYDFLLQAVRKKLFFVKLAFISLETKFRTELANALDL